MTHHEFLTLLRAATEVDVLNALEGAWVSLPITTPAEALELFNVIVDELTGDRDQADAMDRARIASAKNCTRRR